MDSLVHERLGEKFITLLVNKLLGMYPDAEIHNLFNGKNREIVKKELVKFGMDSLSRVKTLYISGYLQPTDHDLNDIKKRGMIPTDIEFYELIKTLPSFYGDSNDVLFLRELLEYKPLNSFRNVFLSYSFLDQEFANILYERLTLHGVNVKMYERDNPTGSNQVYMRSAIQESDRMLFLASKNSLTSDSCHFELKECIEYIRQRNDQARLLVVCLDDYILTTNVLNVFDTDRKKNMTFLRENTSLINKYQVDEMSNNRKLDKWLKPIIEKSILIC